MANLLDKASIILTPTGYSSGVIHNVKPSESPFGDMTFDRNSSSTRVNAQGLIETVASDIPRIDYSKGSGAILSELASTNQVRYSEDFSNALWTKSAINMTSSTKTNPKGVNQTVYNITGAPAPGDGLFAIFASTPTGQGTGVSIWIKRTSGAGSTGNVWIGSGTQSSGTGNLVAVGNEWQRISYVAPQYGGNRIYIKPQYAHYFDIWGAQGEYGLVGGGAGRVTSYIPTTSTSVSRTADEYLNGGDVSLINSPSGVLFVERQCISSSTNEFILLTATGQDETVSIGVYGNSNGFNSVRVKTSTSTLYKGFGGAKTNMDKLAVKWDGTSVKTFRNGALAQTGTLSGGFTANQLTELHLSTGQGFYGELKQLAVFNEALTDAEIIAITTP